MVKNTERTVTAGSELESKMNCYEKMRTKTLQALCCTMGIKTTDYQQASKVLRDRGEAVLPHPLYEQRDKK